MLLPEKADGSNPTQSLFAHAWEAGEQSISSPFNAVRSGLLLGGIPVSSHPSHTRIACPHGNNKKRRPFYWLKINLPAPPRVPGKHGGRCSSMKLPPVVLRLTIQVAAFFAS